MTFFKRFTTLFLLPMIAVLVIFYCSLPDDPGDPSNTAISIVIKTPDGKIHPNSLADTVNKKFSIGAALRLPENFDSIHLTITFKENTIFDTVFTNHGNTNFYSDTIWTECTFFSPGIYYATFTPVTSLNIHPVTANIMMVEADVMPENHKPVISVLGNTIFAPGDTCVLSVTTSDTDANQILTAATKGKPEGSVLKNNAFTWAIPINFTGRDTITFLVSDNGFPQESDTEIVVITVTSTPHAPRITIFGDSILKPLEICTLTINTSDEDAGQTLLVTMAGAPEGASLVNNSQFTWTAPNVASAKHIVTFTVTDNGTPPFSTSAKVTLSVTSGTAPNKAPKWSLDTLPHSMNTTATYSLSLSEICSDTDNDKLTYALLPGAPQGDTIIDSNYTFTATTAASGTHFVRIVAADPIGAKDTLVVKLIVDQSTVDTTAPEVVFVAPENGSVTTTTSSYTIDILCSDATGIASVIAKLGETQFPAIYSNGHYTMAITGLLPGIDNTVVVTAKDSSAAKNSISKTVIIKYNATRTVTYNANTGTGTVPSDVNTYATGATITVMGAATLTKIGYTFAGWNTAADGSGTAHAASTTFAMGSANIVLFAQWTNNPTFTVNYNANTGAGTVPIDVNLYEAGATITAMGAGTLTKTGTSFAGWNTAADGSGTAHAASTTFAMGSANLVLFAQWTTNPTFTVTYNANTATGTAPVDANMYEAGATVTAIGAGTLTKTGTAFSGWNTAADGSGTAHAAGTTFAMGSANLVLFAQWTTNPTFTITYNANTSTGITPVDDNKYEAGAMITAVGPGTLTKAGATFAGWNTAADGSGTAHAAGTTFAMGSANLVLFAQWTTNATFAVVYNANTGAGTVPVDVNKYETGATITSMGAGTLTKIGYAFAGWNTKADGSGTAYTAGATLNMGTAIITLYARWTIKQYAVTYNGNEFNAGAVPIDAILHDSGSMVTVLGNSGGLTRVGYTFDGWNTAANGSGNSYIAATGTFTISSTVILYAKWKIKTYTLTYDGNTSTGGSPPSSGSPYDSNAVVTVAGNTNLLTKMGRDFNGWNSKADGSGTPLIALATFRIKSDTTLYAQWIVKKYTLTVSTPGNGTISPSGAVTVDSAVATTITATPASGFKFKQWSVTSGSATIASSSSANTTVSLNHGSATVQAVFGCLTFAKKLQLQQYDVVSLNSAIQTDDGGYLIVGTTGTTALLIKLNSTGDTILTKTFFSSTAASLQKAGTGYVVGGSYSFGSYSDLTAACFAQNGNKLWDYSYTDNTNSYYAHMVRMTTDNGFIIGGSTNYNLFLIKTDAGRNNTWVNEYDGGGLDGLSDCVQTSDGGYMMAGGANMGVNSCIIKTNALGTQVWRNYFESTLLSSGMSCANSVQTMADGDCIIGGSVTNSSGSDGYILKVSQSGTVNLFKKYTNAITVCSVQPRSDGYILAGSTQILGNGQNDIYIVKTNSSGTILKETAYGTSADEQCTSMKLTNDGGCIVTGSDNWVIKADENGEVQ